MKRFQVSSIVGRLQLAFLCILTAALSVVFLILYEMTQVRQAKDIVFSFDVPALIATEKINLDFTTLLDMAYDLVSEDRPEEIERIYERQSEIRAQLFRELGKASKSMEAMEQQRVLDRLVQIGGKIDQIHTLSLERFALQQAKRLALEGIRVIEAQITQAIETVLLEQTFRLGETDVVDGRERGDVARIAAQLGTVSFFKTEMQRLYTLLDSAARTENLTTLSEIEVRIRNLVRSTTQTVLAFDGEPFARDFARAIDASRVLAFEKDGLLPNARALLGVESERRELGADIIRNAADSAAGQSEILSETGDRIAASGERIERAINRTLSIAVGSTLLVIVPVLLVVRYILKYQIAIRMSRLTDTVQRIAGGDYNARVEVSGHDEVASIAGALAVFKRQAAELERSNTDLERFAHVASHDLRSPLKSIHNLASWVIEDAGPELSEENRGNLAMIISRATRLRRLSEDLLAYARINGEMSAPEVVDLPDLVADVIDLIDCPPDFTILTEISLDRVVLQPSPLRQILLNLVVNAVKHHDSTRGTIWVMIDVVGEFLRLTIRDDGPGIPREYHARVFRPFEKLESRDVVEGSGMGLAIICRLVEVASGRIALRSAPERERGAVFIVELPVEPAPTSPAVRHDEIVKLAS